MENDPGFDVFVSYAHLDAPWVLALADALRAEDVRVWLDDAAHADAGIPDFSSIQRSIETGLGRSRGLLACYSTAYPTRRACQWELTAAFLAAQALDEGERRLLVVNPESSVDHVRPLELRDARMVELSDRHSPAALATVARQVAAHVAGLRDRACLGEVRRARDPVWYGRARLGLDSFVGRSADLWDLHSTLRGPRHAIITGRCGRPVAAVCGIGGQGKTMLANEYALRFGAAYPGGVFWLRGYATDRAGTARKEHHSVLDAQWRRFASDRGLQVETADSRAFVRALRDDLAAAPPSLWIVDDLPDGLSAEDIGDWLAPGENTPTLITTRSRAYDRLLRPVVLERLSDDAGLELLTSRRPPADAPEREKAVEIVTALAGHPLALEVAGSWMAGGASTYAEFAGDLRQDQQDVLELAADLAGELPTGHERSIAGTLSHSVRALAADGLRLLRLGAVVSEAPIPVSLITQYFEVDCSSSAGQARIRATRALTDARRLSLVGGDAASPVVHGLVSRTVRFQQRKILERCRRRATTALRRVMEAGVDLSDVNQLDWLCAHARALTRDAVTQDDAQLLELLGSLEESRGNHRAGEVALGRLVEVSTRLRGEKHASTLVAKASMARAMGNGGDTTSAVRVLSEVLADLRERLGEEDDDTCRTKVALAKELREAKRLDESRRLLEDVSYVYRRRYGEHHAATAVVTFELASTLREVGELGEALALQERALETLRASVEVEDTEVLAAMHNLAVTRAEFGDRDGAIALFEQTLASRRRMLGESHSDTLATWTRLAYEYRAAGRLPTARDLLEQLLEQSSQRFGREHPETLHAMDGLAFVMSDLGDASRATTLGEEARWASAGVFGEAHPRTLTRASNLAALYARAGRNAEALEIAQATVARVREALRESPERFLVILNLGSILKRLGHLDRALDLQQEAVDGLRATKGERHRDTLAGVSNLAQTLFEQRRYPEAKELQERVLVLNELDADHPTTLTMKGNLASTLSHLGDHRRAAELQQAVLEGQERVLGTGHPETLLSLKKMVEVLVLCGEWTAAFEMIERGLDRLSPGIEDPGIIQAARHYIDGVCQTDPGAMVAMESRIVKTLQQRLPPDSPEVLQARQSLVSAYLLAGELERACELGEQTLADFRRVRGPQDEGTCEAIVLLTSAYVKRGMNARARDTFLSNLQWLMSRDPSTLTEREAALRSQVAALIGR